ncbi:MAG TPA: NTP transferase domain-containing protein [Sporichthyaceae bacterium]|jgi:molybdopterin-guanine dinucleotide biosynthesis protein A
MDAAGVVLAGGRSSRMGTPKAALEWHGSTLLHRTAALLQRSVSGPVVVVAAPGQELPALPDGVQVTYDPVEGRGPMQGIAVGLAAVEGAAEAAFVTSTDLPFLHPAYIHAVLAAFRAEPTDVALPVARGYRQPTAAVYRTGLAALIATLLGAGEDRPGQVYRHCAVRVIEEAELLAHGDVARLDPALDSVTNINEPEDYAAARARPAPEILVECFGALVGADRPRKQTVAAATLGAAADAIGLSLDAHVVAALNGDRISRAPGLPLVAGDTVAFLSADAGG